MIAPPKPDLVTVNIDGREIAVPKGTNVIEAARLVNVDVPHYCYHPKLTIVGNCRMCLIEMGMPAVDPATKAPIMDPATGKQKINWIPRPQIGCGTNVSPGLHVKTTSPMVKDAREGVMEFLLINHPLDCPICDQAGECKLQEFSAEYGRGYSRYVDEKNAKPKKTRLGPRVTLDDERCILCSRCVRFSSEIAKDPVLGFVNRGSYNTLTCFPGRELDNNYSLNTVDICPVGALTSTDFRFKMRVWFLKQTPSIDTESSAGANTTVWSREGKIYRITPRQNDAVNDTWMADSGRELFKAVDAPNRVTNATVKNEKATLEAALAAASEALSAGPLAIVGSSHMSVEEQRLLARLAKSKNASVYIPAHAGKGDGLLVSEDRTPNFRGALVTGLTDRAPVADLKALAADIDAGKVKSVLIVREDAAMLGLPASALAKVRSVVLATHHNVTTAAAEVVLPALTVFERSGSFINCQFRLQSFAQAVPGPTGVLPDALVLSRLAGADAAAVWSELSADVPALAGLAGRLLPAEGVQLDGSAFAAHKFPEGKLLKFAPVATA